MIKVFTIIFFIWIIGIMCILAVHIDKIEAQLTRIESTQQEIKAVTDQMGIFDRKNEK